MTSRTCFQCINFSGGPVHGCCIRPMTMTDGSTRKLLRPWQTERDAKHKFWRDKGRSLPDVCGARAKFWSER